MTRIRDRWSVRGACAAWILVAVFGWAATGTEAATGKIVVYAALDEKVITEVARAFKAESGVDAELLTIAAAGTLATRIKGEKASPKADIFVGGSADFHAPLAAEGLLVPSKSPKLAEAKIDPAFVDPAGHWHGWYLGALSIIVNRDRFQKDLAPKGVAMPKTWDDLVNAAYKGHFLMPSPITTGGGYIFIANQVFRLGEEKAFEYLKKLAANASQFTPTAPLSTDLVARGETIVAMNWGHEGLVQKRQGFPLEVVFPPDTAFEIGAVSIVKGGPNPEGAKAFVDFLLTKTPQEINAKLGLRYPTRPDAAVPEGAQPFNTLRFVKYDRDWATQNKERLQKKWQAEIQK
jgi:iron(III) transport system substrate-binding protein